MEYITCNHPKAKIVVKTEITKAMDAILKYITPKPYCENCNSYLPVLENPASEIVRFWFIKQDGLVKAQPIT